ncbi:MAG: HAD-IC family P-type ATPase, partial [Acidimicrobiia bacterium]
MTPTSTSAASIADATDRPLSTPAAYRLTVDDVFTALGTDPSRGLADTEVGRRREQVGPNKLADAAKRPRWKALLDQFKDFLILILLVAAVVSFVVSGELKTPIVIAIVVVMNAIIGFIQESRAEASLDALKKMLVTGARVRRNGDLVAIDAVDLVPGDLVHLEAGDRVPADGRLVSATNVEIEEAALTGESQPGPKGTDAIDRAEVPLGDRRNMA